MSISSCEFESHFGHLEIGWNIDINISSRFSFYPGAPVGAPGYYFKMPRQAFLMGDIALAMGELGGCSRKK